MKPCLHSEKEVNLKNYVGNNQALLSKINETIYNKPLEHHMIEEKESKKQKNDVSDWRLAYGINTYK